MKNGVFIQQRSKKLWTLKFDNGDFRNFPTQEEAERFCAKLGATPTRIPIQKSTPKKPQHPKKKNRRSHSQGAMKEAEFLRLRLYELSQKRGRILGTASPKGTLSASSFPAYLRIEEGGAIETNKKKF